MYDVFVSYARVDGSDLARRTACALEDRGRQVWVDTDDMPPAAEITPEIRAAIDGSDNFLIVVTDWSMSEFSVCRIELEHAVARGKRIVPIRSDPLGPVALPKDTPASIRALDVIGVGEGEAFKSGVDRLVAAFDLDLPWIRQHTRLLLRAVDWLAHDGEDSWLLRGGDLEEAERWLASPPRRRQVTPPISLGGLDRTAAGSAGDVELQRRLIAASRRRADADHDAEVAAQMLVLARTAFERGPATRPLATRLAIESMCRRRTPSGYELLDECRSLLPVPRQQIRHEGVVVAVGAGPGSAAATSDDRGELRVTDASNGELRWSRTHAFPITHAHFAAAAHRLATGADRAQIEVWDARDGQQVAAFPHPEPLRSVEISDDGRFVVTSSGHPAAIGASLVRIFDADAQTAVGVEHDKLAKVRIHPVMVSADGPAIAAASHDGAFRLVDVNGVVLDRTPLGLTNDWVVDVAVSRAHPWVALTTFSGDVQILDLVTRRWVMRTFVGGQAAQCAFGPHGQTFAAIAGDGTIIVWDTDGWTILARVPAPEAHTVLFGPTDNFLLVLDYASTVRLWQVAPLREVMGLTQVHVGRFAVAPETGALVLAHDDRRTAWVLEPFDTTDWQPHVSGSLTSIGIDRDRARILLGGERPDPSNPWISKDHPRPGFVATCDEDLAHNTVAETPLLVRSISADPSADGALIVDRNSVSRVSWATGEFVVVHAPPGGVGAAAIVADGTRVALTDAEGRLVVLTGDPLAPRTFDQPGPYSGVAISGDGRVVAGRLPEAVAIHHVDGAPHPRVIPVGGPDIWARSGRGLALSSEGALVAVAAGTGVKVYDTASGRLISQGSHQWAPFVVAFTERRELVASASASSIGAGGGFGDLRVWATASGRNVLETPLDASVRALAIAPDGVHVACATDTGGISLFRLDEAAGAVGRLRRVQARWLVTGLAFSTRGDWLFATSGRLMSRHLWREPDLVTDTARRLTVEPAAQLWTQATGGEPYRGPSSSDTEPS